VQVRAGFRLGLVAARIAENRRLSSRLMTSLMTAVEACRSWEPGITVDTATAQPDRFGTRVPASPLMADVGVETPALTNDTARSTRKPF